ncbi:MAG: hypothetical protein KIS73_30415, partial [Enhydrobacter sp.]|nr:hypothetical protein [Enhydrobacter sp.]
MGEVVLGYGAPPLPFGSVDDIGAFGAYVLFRGADPLNLGAHEGQHYLLVASPFDPNLVVETPAPPLPFGDAGDGSMVRFTIKGDSPKIYPASTLARSSEPEDEPANIAIPGALFGRINFAVDFFDRGDPLTAGKAGAGALRIADPGGELDNLLQLGWDGAAISLKRGREQLLFKDWQTVAVLTSSQLLATMREKELNLRDLAWAMSTADLHGQVYAGTGGLEGDATWKGKSKPYGAGYCRNISPPLIAAAPLIYQTTYTSARAITAVRDGGVPLTPTVDYPTYEALADATIAGGTFATCKAFGLIRVGATPVFGITADIEGDNDTIAGQGFPRTRGQIARRIATRLGFVRLSEASQFDFGALAAFESLQPAPVGWWWDAAITKEAALNQIMQGCLGWWTVRIDGRFALGQVEDPSFGSPDFVLSYPAKGSGEARLGEPTVEAILPPRRGTFIGFGRNYTIQSPSQLALGLTATEIQAWGQATRFAVASDQWTAN